MDFDAEWARCAPWLSAALERAKTHDLADVEAMVRAGEAKFWPGRRAAVVTEVCVYPKMRVLHFWLAGGDLAELRDEMEPMISWWARTHEGCGYARISGRPGWARALPGYAPVATTCAKEL